VFLALAARLDDHVGVVGSTERALYEDRSLVRMLGMRRTMFVVPREDVATVHAACTEAIAAVERRKLLDLLREARIAPDADAWLRDVAAATLAALDRMGDATGAELSAQVPELRRKVTFAAGKAYEATVTMTTRVLFLLAAEGLIVRGRPRGSWISSQFQWARTGRWLGADIPPVPVEEARTHLVRAWLRSFGPGTVEDLRWWSGLTIGAIRRSLDELHAVAVGVDGTGAVGYLLPDDIEPTPPAGPWGALLPALDPTVMAWKDRAWFLGGHGAALFDRTGNAGPTAWWDGRVVGGWAQRRNGEVVVELLEDAGAEARASLQGEAERLRTMIGGVRVTPRFRTPLERKLSI
jgi:hypothetical protein